LSDIRISDEWPHFSMFFSGFLQKVLRKTASFIAKDHKNGAKISKKALFFYFFYTNKAIKHIFITICFYLNFKIF